MISLLVVTALVFVYNKLLDLVPKHQLFYYVGLFYFCVFSCVAFMLASPTHGLANTKADPSRLLGMVPISLPPFLPPVCDLHHH